VLEILLDEENECILFSISARKEAFDRFLATRFYSCKEDD